jgi:hypothetical protein
MMARPSGTGLQRDSVGLTSVLFMSVTNMAPGAAVAFSILFAAGRDVRLQRTDAGELDAARCHVQLAVAEPAISDNTRVRHARDQAGAGGQVLAVIFSILLAAANHPAV